MNKRIISVIGILAMLVVIIPVGVSAATGLESKNIQELLSPLGGSGDLSSVLSGDGDLGAWAGCGCDLGYRDTGLTQPMSLIALLTGLCCEEVRPYFHQAGDTWAAPKDRLREAMERGGHSPSYAKPSLFPVRDDRFMLMANHEYGVRGTSAHDVTRATIRARRELHGDPGVSRRRQQATQRAVAVGAFGHQDPL